MSRCPVKPSLSGHVDEVCRRPNGDHRQHPGWSFPRVAAHAGEPFCRSASSIQTARDRSIFPGARTTVDPCRNKAAGKGRAQQQMIEQDWTDALRALHPGERIYTFWKYFRNAFAAMLASASR